MRMYKAAVRSREDNKILFIESEYPSKKAFAVGLRANGYKVNPAMIKQTVLFEYIVDYTNCSPEDWKLRVKDIPAWYLQEYQWNAARMLKGLLYRLYDSRKGE